MPLSLVATFPVGPLGCNCAIVADPETRDALVVDPGDEPDRVLAELERASLRPVGLLHTHAHFDHIGRSALLSRLTGAPILLHASDVPLYRGLKAQGRLFGFALEDPGPVGRTLADGEAIACGGSSLEVFHTPGHTPGSLCFTIAEGGRTLVFSGDTLFRRSIGRTDLPGGSFDEIVASIETRLFRLPGDAFVLPGHGEPTTIAEESRLNPFVGDRSRRLS